MARSDGQLIRRRIFSDKGEPDRPPLREGLVPLSIPNERSALLAYWEKEDAIAAEKEAAEADEALQAISQPPAPSAAELVEPLAQRLVSAEAELGILRDLKQATPDAVLEGVHQIARAAGAAGFVEAAAKTAIASVDAAVAGAQALLAKIEGTVNKTADAVGQLLIDGRQSLERTQAEMVAKTNKAVLNRILKFEVDVSKMRGKTGPRGRIGQGLIVGAGPRPENRPDGSEWELGDSYLNVRPPGYALEYLSADGWSKPVRMVPEPRLINATQHVLDMAPRQSTTIVQSAPASSGGGGQERLMTSRQAGNAEFTIADSSNYAASNQLISGGEITIRVVSETTGQSGLLVATFTLDNTNHFSYTSFSELGDLYLPPSTFSVDLDGSHQSLRIPPGITPGALTQQALIIKARINGAGSYQITGGVSWTLKGDGVAVPKGGAGPQPLWVWS